MRTRSTGGQQVCTFLILVASIQHAKKDQTGIATIVPFPHHCHRTKDHRLNYKICPVQDLELLRLQRR